MTRIVTSKPGAAQVRWSAEESVSDWETFVAWLRRNPEDGGKYDRPYVPVTLKKAPGPRKNTNLGHRYLITLDADSAGDDYLGCLGAWESLSHTTASHTPENPRWRTIVPVSRPMTPEEHKTVATWLVGATGADRFDIQASTSPAHVAYAPAWAGVEWHAVSGPVLDVDDVLMVAEPIPWGTREGTGGGTLAEFLEAHSDSGGCAYGAKALDGVEHDLQHPKPGQHRHTMIYAAAARWVELVKAGCWDAKESSERLERIATGLRDGERPREWSEAQSSAVADDPDADARCSEHEDPSGDFDPVTGEMGDDDTEHYDRSDIGGDSNLGQRLAREYLAGEWVAWGRSRWAKWDGRRWDLWVPEDEVVRVCSQALLDVQAMERREAYTRYNKALRKAKGDAEAERVATKEYTERLKVLGRLRMIGTVSAAMKIARAMLSVRMERFDGDQTRWLLNCANGVVDLRTGELLRHDKRLLFTRVTEVAYRPGATHPDWDKALNALGDEEVVEWMGRRFGQAATGFTPPDDVIPFLRGGGENGKTTLMAGIQAALGEFYTLVPDKVLVGGSGDHPTEFMTLKGARLALLEELPGGDWLEDTRLKKAIGSETGMTARAIGQDNVSWKPTHSLMVTTNHRVQVSDTTHGTWRRLKEVPFTKVFAKGERDSGLRGRLHEERQAEAVLAWVVAGAVRVQEVGLERDNVPEVVERASKEWRTEGNHPARFIDETMEIAGHGVAVSSGAVYLSYREWAVERGQRPVSDQVFWRRAAMSEKWADIDVSGPKVVKRSTWEVIGMNGSTSTTARAVTGLRPVDGFTLTY